MLTLLCLALAPQVWTVDDDGPAHFPDLDLAIQASSPGDVILVEPGSYHPAPITHDLTIVGSSQGAKPDVWDELVIDGVSDVTLSGLDLTNLQVKNCVGRVRIDDCDLLWSFDPGEYGTFRVRDSAVVVITRTRSEPGWAPLYAGSPALSITNSEVVVVDSELHGPNGQDDILSPDWGYEGISTFGTTKLTVVGSNVSGGSGGYSSLGQSEPGAPAIRGYWSSDLDLVIRGSWFHRIEGGEYGGGGSPEPSVWISGGTVSWSGATLDPVPISWPKTVPAEPYLLLGGTDGPGAERRIQAYGNTGMPLVTVFSTEPAPAPLPGLLGDELAVSLNHLVTTRTTVLLGQDVPANVALPLPTDPAFAGLALDVQGLAVTPLGMFLTNAHQLVLQP